MENKKVVHNGPIAKVIRTFGFILVLIGSGLLLLDVLASLEISFLVDKLNQLDDYLVYNFTNNLIGLKYLYVIVGLIILVFTQSKNWFLIILSTILILFTTINVNTTGAVFFEPLKEQIFIGTSWLEKISDLMNQYINTNQYIPFAINLVTIFMVYIILAIKKPSRVSTKLVSSGLLLLVIGAALHSFPLISNIQFLQEPVYLTISNSVLAGALFLQTLGSALGVLGIFRK